MDTLRSRFVALLRWSEKYTKTDMVYLASGGFWLNADFIVTSLGALILAVLYAHLLSKTDYGVYQYILSLAGILTAISLTGMNPAVTQSVAQGKEGLFKRSLSVQVIYNLISSAVAIGIALYYFAFGNDTIAILMVIAAITLPFLNAGTTYQAFLTGRLDFRGYFLYDTVFNVLYTLCMVGVVFISRDGGVLAATYLISSTLLTVGLCFYALKKERPNDIPDEPNISYAKHLSVMGVLGMIAARVDSILVFHFLGPIDLALYTFAKIIPEKILGLLKSIGSLSFSKIATREISMVDAHMLRKIIILTAVSLSVAGIYAICTPLIFKILFPAYTDAILYSQALAFILIGAAAYLPSSALMAKIRKTELYILNTVYPIIQIILYFVFLYYFGLWGMIVARLLNSLLFSILTTVLLFISERRHAVRTVS